MSAAEHAGFTVAERSALLGPWPIIMVILRDRTPDPNTMASLTRQGLCIERVTFGRIEWRLTAHGRLLRARMLDLCPTCERSLSSGCFSWCSERKDVDRRALVE